MTILFDQNYPKYALDALQLIHKLDINNAFTLAYWTTESDNQNNKPVVFILDRSIKGIDIITQKHVDAGYKVFAFKLRPRAKLEFFKFALTLLSIWPKVLDIVNSEQQPFVYIYRYGGKKLIKKI